MNQKNKIPSIFLSYSWNNKDQASIIENDFNKIGIPLIKDTLNLKYKDSISDYMRGIRNADFALILLSDNYLKSENCMFEALEILKEQDHKERVLPIILSGTKIFNAKDRIQYIKYWKNRKDSLTEDLKDLDITSSLSSYEDLKTIDKIYNEIDSFLKFIGDQKTSTLTELKQENYKSIVEYLGYEDITFIKDLLLITQIQDLNIKEVIIDKHIERFGESYLALSTKASIKNNLGKIEEAKKLYEKSLLLNPDNEHALNNLGYLIHSKFEKHKVAIEYYKKAIKINPNLIIARINLAVAYNILNKVTKAKKEYLKILEIAPFEAKAHNNISNIYKSEKNVEKVIFHLEKAIEYNPKYAEAYLNLGNYYDVVLNQFDKAIPLYNKAQKLANNKTMDYIIDSMYRLKKRRDSKERKSDI